MSRTIDPGKWGINCWSLFAVSVIAVALVTAHYSAGAP